MSARRSGVIRRNSSGCAKTASDVPFRRLISARNSSSGSWCSGFLRLGNQGGCLAAIRRCIGCVAQGARQLERNERAHAMPEEGEWVVEHGLEDTHERVNERP